ncbi:MAG: tetratricopeptide repeat protein [Pseudomonadota bacterium]
MSDVKKIEACLAAEDWAGAEALLRKLSRGQNPSHAVMYQLGRVLARQGKVGQAIPWLRKAVAAKKDHAPSLAELGQMQLAQGNEEAAIDALARSVHLRPTNVETRLTLARLALKREHWEQAESLWRTFIETEHRVEALAARITICEALGDEEAAAKYRLRHEEAIAAAAAPPDDAEASGAEKA